MGQPPNHSAVQQQGEAHGTASSARHSPVYEERLALYLNRFEALKTRIDAQRLAEVEAALHFEIGTTETHDFFEVLIAGGEVTLSRSATTPARLTITLTGEDFLLLTNGQTSTAELFIQGRLKVTGDMIFATQLGPLLGLAP